MRGTLDSARVAYVNHSASDFALMHVSCELYGDWFPPEIRRRGVPARGLAETSGTWGSPVSIATRRGTEFIGTAGSCPTSNTCLVVGGLFTGKRVSRDRDGIIRRWSGPARFQTHGFRPCLKVGLFYGLSCPTALLCVAVGEGRGLTKRLPSIAASATWSGGRWSSIGVLHGVMFGPEASNELLSICCLVPEPFDVYRHWGCRRFVQWQSCIPIHESTLADTSDLTAWRAGNGSGKTNTRRSCRHLDAAERRCEDRRSSRIWRSYLPAEPAA